MEANRDSGGGKKTHTMPHRYPESIQKETLCPHCLPRIVFRLSPRGRAGFPRGPSGRAALGRWLIGRSRSSRLAPFISANGDYWEPTDFNASCGETEGERGEQQMSRADVGK